MKSRIQLWLLAGVLLLAFLSLPASALIYVDEEDGTEIFLIALAVEELGYVELEGVEPDDRFSPGFYSKGRLALYLQGKIKGEYLLEIAFDSDKPILETAEDFIQPEEYYPVYGDESRLSTDASSQGRLYALLEHDQSYLLYGRYSTGFTDSFFANYDRTLRGTKVHVERGDYKLTLFDVRTNQISVEDEFPKERTEGGTCDELGTCSLGSRGPYYLSEVPVIPDTEKVVIEVRDKDDSDEVLESTPQTKDYDYTINYSTGRLMFSRFIPSWDSQGNPIFIVVNYEAIPPGNPPAHTIWGGKTTLSLDENASLDITYVKDAQSTPAHALADVRTEIELGSNVDVAAEYAYSTKDEEDSAQKIELDYMPSPDVEFNTFYKQVRPDFVDFDGSTADVEEYGINGRLRVTENLMLLPRIKNTRDNVLRDSGETTTKTLTYGADVEYSHPGWPLIFAGFGMEDMKEEGGDVFFPSDSSNQSFSLGIDNTRGGFPFILELDRQDFLDHTDYSTDTAETGVALTVPFEIGTIADAEIVQEHIFAQERETGEGLSTTNRTTFAWEALAADNIWLTGDYCFEDQLCHEYDERTETQTAGLVAEVEVTDQLFLTSGYQWEWVHGMSPSDSNVLSLTCEYVPWDVLTLDAGYQVQRDAYVDEAVTTHVYDFAAEYVPTLTFSAAVGGTFEKGEDELFESFSLLLEGKPYSDITLSGGFSQESTREARTNGLMIRHTETTLALAYRPITFDHFNALLKCEIKNDEDRTSGFAPASTTVYWASEGIYDLTERLAILGKYAHKRLSEEDESTSDMIVFHPTYKLGERFEVGAEYRILRHLEMKNQEVSTSCEIGYRLADYLKVIAGYNFQGYQELSAEDDEWIAQGPYVKIVCQL